MFVCSSYKHTQCPSPQSLQSNGASHSGLYTSRGLTREIFVSLEPYTWRSERRATRLFGPKGFVSFDYLRETLTYSPSLSLQQGGFSTERIFQRGRSMLFPSKQSWAVLDTIKTVYTRKQLLHSFLMFQSTKHPLYFQVASRHALILHAGHWPHLCLVSTDNH